MQITEFRQKVKPGSIVSIEGSNFTVREVVKFRLDDSSYYVKCFLSNGYVLADDINANAFLLIKETKTLFTEPFSEEIEFDGKKFKFLYSAHAIAEITAGEEIFKKSASEKFWDYKADDDSYLSLGIIDTTKERMDLCGTIVQTSGVNLK